MGKTKVKPSAKMRKNKKGCKNSLKGERGNRTSIELDGGRHMSNSKRSKNSLSLKRQRKKEAQEEHDEFRAEQLNLWQRHHKKHVVKDDDSSRQKEKTKQTVFVPKDASFKPSNDVILSHGLHSRVQLGNSGNRNNSNMGCDRGPNPLQTLAKQYHREEELMRQQERQGEQAKGNNRFAALLAQNDSSSDEEDVHNSIQSHITTNSSTTFQFAPASFTFDTSLSQQSKVPSNNNQNESQTIFVDPDPDL